MSDQISTHTITSQGPILVNPVNGLTTEVVQNPDNTWSFNWTSIFDDKVLSRKCEGVFGSRADAENAREAFRENERKKARPAFFVK